MDARKADRRSEKTRQRLRETLLALIVERGYEKLTVRHILNRAEIGRATFYEHFRHNEDLLGSGIEQLRAHLCERDRAMEERLGFGLALFDHVDSHRRLYNAIVGAMWSILTWWLDYKVALSPAEMNRLFRQLTFPGLDATLGGKLVAVRN